MTGFERLRENYESCPDFREIYNMLRDVLAPISMKTFVMIKLIWSSTHDESRVQHDQVVPKRVEMLWFVKKI